MPVYAIPTKKQEDFSRLDPPPSEAEIEAARLEAPLQVDETAGALPIRGGVDR
jgi:hypothetical protein